MPSGAYDTRRAAPRPHWVPAPSRQGQGIGLTTQSKTPSKKSLKTTLQSSLPGRARPAVHRLQSPLDERLRALALLFLKLGTISFGGPAAHIALMEDEVVRKRRWLTRQQYLDMLGLTNLIPGPNSTEMAINVGFVRAGWPGLVVALHCARSADHRDSGVGLCSFRHCAAGRVAVGGSKTCGNRRDFDCRMAARKDCSS